jgi:hypothetical protein
VDRHQFANAGLREVALPSGALVRGVLPTVEALYLRDLVPAELIGVVTKFAMPGFSSDDLPEEERPLWFRFTRLQVAAFLREIRDADGNWQPLNVSIDDTFTMDQRDVDELEYIVLRYKTPRQVSAFWQAQRGEITKEEANAIIEAEMADTIGGWATFRLILEGLVASQDGTDVRSEAKSDARPNRATRRGRGRRGAESTTSP